MASMRPRTRPALAALALALALVAATPGCLFVRRVVPTDASGMRYPLEVLGDSVADQWERTADAVANLPSTIAAQFHAGEGGYFGN
jgi:hypothetical protein